MIKKGMVRGLVLGCMLSMAASFGGGAEVKAESASADEYVLSELAEDEKNNRAAQLVWYYKVENGNKYRRLYDSTNEVWLTDWILCE